MQRCYSFWCVEYEWDANPNYRRIFNIDSIKGTYDDIIALEKSPVRKSEMKHPSLAS